MLLAFGELMLRLAPAGHLRLRQVLPGQLEATFAGAEANVCASLAMLGFPARLLTAVPDNPISDAAIANLRGLGIDTRFVLRRPAGRLGIYFVEAGANQRSSNVIYDRDGSAISLAGPKEYPFEAALEGVTAVHTTGITPSLSEPAYQATLALLKLARSRGLHISCDLNFRKKLWRWRPDTDAKALAGECMSELLPLVNLLIANEEDAADVLDIHAPGASIEEGKIDPAGYEAVARQIVERFPNLQRVAITLRQSLSADHNKWGALLFDAASKQAYLAPLDEANQYQPYEIRDIVDRVGGGDAFGAGLLYAFGTRDLSHPETALKFAVAASCLKHSILGDFNYVTRDEILNLAAGAASGRVRR